MSGKIHELSIHVPWTKLYSEPAVITINTIECVLKIRDDVSQADDDDDDESNVLPADVKTVKGSSPSNDNEKTLPPGYVQSLLNKVLYNLSIKVNNLILKYVEDDIVLSVNIKSAEFYSTDENWSKAFVDVSAPDWILHKTCNITDLTVCLDRRNASGVIEMYQDPLAYKCNLSCRMQVFFDKEGFHLPIEKNISVYCECLEVSVTDQQLPLLIRLARLGLGLYYGTIDVPGCQPSSHSAKDIMKKQEQKSNIISPLGSSFTQGVDTELSNDGWLSWAYSMVPSLSTDPKTQDASLVTLTSRFSIYVSQASLNLKITEATSDGQILGGQRFVFKPILSFEASGIAQEIVLRGGTFMDFQIGVTSVTGWLIDAFVGKNERRPFNEQIDEDGRDFEVCNSYTTGYIIMIYD